jgi:hypothetical protein
LYQPQIIGEGDCGAIGGMKIGKGNRSTRRKPAPAPLCPPHIPLDPGSYFFDPEDGVDMFLLNVGGLYQLQDVTTEKIVSFVNTGLRT